MGMPKSEKQSEDRIKENQGIKEEFLLILKEIKSYLENLQRGGVNFLLVKEKSSNIDKVKLLEKLREEAENCRKCELYKYRKNLVFGDGNPDAELLFVGEAPGFDEDKTGIPFVGKAGQLLNKILEEVGFKRSEVYICNVVKCHPPQNRNPNLAEIAACKDFLLKQIEIIKPKVICTLGKFAAQTLLNSKESITILRGRVFDYQGIKLIPAFHPAYLLRNPAQKKFFVEDLKLVKSLLKS